MRNRRIAPVVAACLLSLAALTLPACGADHVLVPNTDEPFLYLVLNEKSLATYSTDFVQHALLLTNGSPLESPHYRAAERFEMHRTSDGTPFAWQGYGHLYAEPGTLHGISLDYANYYLPETIRSDSLGTADLRPGETYVLNVTTEGILIQGRTTIPDTFSASLVAMNGHRWVVWPRVRGAGGYMLSFSDGRTSLQQDTAFALADEELDGGWLTIRALDFNLYQYVSDPQMHRAGIDRGIGVFGATTAARLRLFP